MSVTRSKLVASSVLLAAALVIFTATTWIASSGIGRADVSNAAGPVLGIHHDEDGDGEADHVVGISDVSPTQQQALADGYVSREEYEAATWAAFECLVDAGAAAVAEPAYDITGTRMTFAWGDGGPGAEATQRCIDYHSSLVSLNWAKQNRPSEQQRAASEDAMRACMIKGGLPETDVAGASFRDLQLLDEDGRLFVDCLTEVSVEFDIPYISD